MAIRELKEVIDRIIDIEWALFDKVQNTGGRASCQDNHITFDAMRRSQFEAWNGELLESYLSDLETAQGEGRNPVMEKYAYMMEYTAPEEYAELRPALPAVSEEKERLVRQITDRNLETYSGLVKKYPEITSRGRPGYTGEETGFFASVETYLLGELKTYSLKTLRIYKRHMDDLDRQGKELPVMILENTAGRYGFASLDEAEERLKS
jgi:hypothetical protein